MNADKPKSGSWNCHGVTESTEPVEKRAPFRMLYLHPEGALWLTAVFRINHPWHPGHTRSFSPRSQEIPSIKRKNFSKKEVELLTNRLGCFDQISSLVNKLGPIPDHDSDNGREQNRESTEWRLRPRAFCRPVHWAAK